MVLYAITVLIIPVMMIAVGTLWKNNPPKKVNWIYGYRTSRSMKSQEAWEFAHKYSGRLWYKGGVLLTVIAIILLLLSKAIDADVYGKIIIGYMCFELVIMVGSIIPTEIALKRNFN